VKKRLLVTVFVLAAIFVASAVAPAFACSSPRPENEKRFVFFGGDSGAIDLPNDFPLNIAPWKADKMDVHASYVICSNVVIGASLVIRFHCPGLGGAWVQWAHLNAYIDSAGKAWVQQVNSGLPLEDPENVKSLSKDIAVYKLGNSLFASLKTPQTLKAGYPITVYFILPAFSLKLNKIGCLEYSESIAHYSGYSRSSGWTEYNYKYGADANGFFTCADWGYNAEPIADCVIYPLYYRVFVPPAS
jgi:hypothetical protein